MEREGERGRGSLRLCEAGISYNVESAIVRRNKGQQERKNECQTQARGKLGREGASGEFIANNGVSENVNFVFMASNVWAAYADCCHKVDFKFCLPLRLRLSASHSCLFLYYAQAATISFTLSEIFKCYLPFASV